MATVCVCAWARTCQCRWHRASILISDQTNWNSGSSDPVSKITEKHIFPECPLQAGYPGGTRGHNVKQSKIWLLLSKARLLESEQVKRQLLVGHGCCCDKHGVSVPRGECYNISAFQRRKLRHEGSLGNREQSQDSNAGSRAPRLGSGDPWPTKAFHLKMLWSFLHQSTSYSKKSEVCSVICGLKILSTQEENR